MHEGIYLSEDKAEKTNENYLQVLYKAVEIQKECLITLSERLRPVSNVSSGVENNQIGETVPSTPHITEIARNIRENTDKINRMLTDLAI